MKIFLGECYPNVTQILFVYLSGFQRVNSIRFIPRQPGGIGERMKIVGIGNDKNISKKTDRISIEHNGEKYTITPEKDGLRIHKHGICSYMNYILVRPCSANEIVFR